MQRYDPIWHKGKGFGKIEDGEHEKKSLKALNLDDMLQKRLYGISYQVIPACQYFQGFYYAAYPRYARISRC